MMLQASVDQALDDGVLTQDEIDRLRRTLERDAELTTGDA